MEKLKDFLYDISDILLALFIIAIMTTVISWKFAGSFVGNANVPISNEENSSFQTIEDDPSETTPIVEEPSVVEPNVEEPNIKEPNIEEPNPEPEPEQTVVYTSVKIPSGSTGVGIAGIIKDAGLVNSTTDFINRIEARGLSAKLQSGSFKIGSDKSLDEIINILTGQ